MTIEVVLERIAVALETIAERSGYFVAPSGYFVAPSAGSVLSGHPNILTPSAEVAQENAPAKPAEPEKVAPAENIKGDEKPSEDLVAELYNICVTIIKTCPEGNSAGNAKIRELLQGFGCKRMQDVPKDRLPEAIEKAKALVAGA